jgi:hypothetical protein
MALVPQAVPSTGMILDRADAEMAEVSYTAESSAGGQARMASMGFPGPSASLSEDQSTVTAPRLPHTSRVVSSRYGDSRSVNCFPQRHLLHNLHRFMKYSSAAYGVSVPYRVMNCADP